MGKNEKFGLARIVRGQEQGKQLWDGTSYLVSIRIGNAGEIQKERGVYFGVARPNGFEDRKHWLQEQYHLFLEIGSNDEIVKYGYPLKGRLENGCPVDPEGFSIRRMPDEFVKGSKETKDALQKIYLARRWLDEDSKAIGIDF